MMNITKEKYQDLTGRERKKGRSDTAVPNHPTPQKKHGQLKKQPPQESQYDLLALFCRNERDKAVTMPVMAGIFAIATLFWAPRSEVLLWISFLLISKFIHLLNCRKFLYLPRSKINIREWYYRLIASEGLKGCAWASLSLVGIWNQKDLSSADLFQSNIFLFATLMTLLGIRMSFASTVMGFLYAGTLPFTLSVVVRLIMYQDPFLFALASMAAGLNVYFIFLAHGLRGTATQMLEYQYQKNVLIQKLESSKRQAEEANVAKSQFLATMSHELRTPLNAIMGFSEMIKTETFGKLSNPNYLEYAHNIHQSGEHLLSLINDILDLSRIEAGRYVLDEQPIWISDVVSDCRSLMRLKAKSRGISIIQNDETNLGQIWADERALRQISLNLIGNALKFTPEGGRIFLSIGRTYEGGQYLSVKDTGPGIPELEMSEVLEPYGQGSLGRQNITHGSGLGLTIVKKLVELQGGVFEIYSEQGKGTEAIVVFPRKKIVSNNSQPGFHEKKTSQTAFHALGQHSRTPDDTPKSGQISIVHA